MIRIPFWMTNLRMKSLTLIRTAMYRLHYTVPRVLIIMRRRGRQGIHNVS
jgi:hypothetical protein